MLTKEEIALRLVLAPPPWNLLPVCSALILFYSVRKLRRRETLSLTEEFACSLSLLSLASIAQYYPLPDRCHFFWGGMPAIGLLFYGVLTLFRDREPQKKVLFFSVIYVATFAPVFCVNLQSGRQILREAIFTDSSLGVLSGMRLTHEEWLRYRAAKQLIEQYTAKYKDMCLLIDSPDVIYLNFAPDCSFHPVHMHLPLIDRSVYPEFPALLARKIEARKDIVLSRSKFLPGYRQLCSLKQFHTLYLHVPEDRIMPATSTQPSRTTKSFRLPTAGTAISTVAQGSVQALSSYYILDVPSRSAVD